MMYKLGSDWWSRWQYAVALTIMAAIPLLWPSIPPLTDFPGHLAQYHVSLELGRSPWLAKYYDYRWVLVGNLGVDLAILPLAPIFGLEFAAKLIVIAIPVMTVAGLIWLAREIHGHIPASVAFALPLAYAWPFQFGFVNFALSVALMLCATALWMWLGRRGRKRLRALLFIPIGFIIFIAHSVGWGMFGLMIFAIETVEARRAGKNLPVAMCTGALACLPLLPPVLMMLNWVLFNSEGEADRFWRWDHKIYHALTLLRNVSEQFDLWSAIVLYALVLLAVRKRGFRFDSRLGFAALILFIAYLMMPGVAMGAAYADMRMAAYTLAIAVIAIVPTMETRKSQQAVALIALAFFSARLIVHSFVYYKIDRGYQQQLAALDHIPRGARIFAMSAVPCQNVWDQARVDHLGNMAIVRRDAFVNGQWPMPGGRLLSVIYAPAKGFALDPTQFLQPKTCRQDGSYTLDYAVKHLPRSAFDYVWLIDVPATLWPRNAGLLPVWRGDRGALFRVAQ